MTKFLFFSSTMAIVLFCFSSFNACRKQDPNALNASVVNDTTNFLFEDNETGVTLIRYKGTATKVTVSSVYINKPVTAIGVYKKNSYTSYGAFQGTLVESVTIPNSVRDIFSGFDNCINLNNLKLCDSLQNISCTFHGCPNLKNITIPSKLTFLYIYSEYLQSIRFEATNPLPSFSISIFSDYGHVSIPSSAIIYVPRGSIDKYKTMWETYLSSLYNIVGY